MENEDVKTWLVVLVLVFVVGSVLIWAFVAYGTGSDSGSPSTPLVSTCSRRATRRRGVRRLLDYSDDHPGPSFIFGLIVLFVIVVVWASS